MERYNSGSFGPGTIFVSDAGAQRERERERERESESSCYEDIPRAKNTKNNGDMQE
jgi:hypothetical protein